MKRTEVVQPKPAFVPFNLLIETEDEARLLSTLLGKCPGSVQIALDMPIGVACHMYLPLAEFSNKSISIEINVK